MVVITEHTQGEIQAALTQSNQFLFTQFCQNYYSDSNNLVIYHIMS